jgi:putative DNA primase/helicase
MIDPKKLIEFDRQAAQYQPPLRKSSADDYVGVESLSQPDVNKQPPNGVILTNGADLVSQPVTWLWKDWLALGKLHILGGAPGQGKTTIAIAIAATITIGGRWPDGSRCDPGNVLIWSGEDDPADTLLPRLLASGGNRSRCYFVSGTRINGEMQSFDPSRDMPALEEQAKVIGGVKLLIVDPVVSAVTGDSHKNTEVRRALQPLVDLTSRLDCATIGITHFSKGGAGSDPALRLSGSIAFAAVARVVLVASKVSGEDGCERRILARAKSNIGPDDGGYEYHIEQAEPIPGISASYISWGQAVEGTARELLAESDAHDASPERSALDSAADFLRQVLADGVTPVKTIEAEAKSAGVSWASVRRAADKVDVIKQKCRNGWYWRLPDSLRQEAQLAQSQKLEHVERLEHVAKPINNIPPVTEDHGDQEAQEAQHFRVEPVERVDTTSRSDASMAEDSEDF